MFLIDIYLKLYFTSLCEYTIGVPASMKKVVHLLNSVAGTPYALPCLYICSVQINVRSCYVAFVSIIYPYPDIFGDLARLQNIEVYNAG